MRANEFIVEVLDSNPSKPSGIDDRWIVADDGTTVLINSQFGEITVQIYGNREYWVHVEFTRNGFAEITGEGNQFKVFEIVWWVLQKWMRSGPQPQWITFSSETKSRTGLYQRMISRFSSQYGYRSHELSDPEVPREIVDNYESIIDHVFVLSKIKNQHSKQDVTEDQTAKSGIVQTDVYGSKAYHAKCLEPNCDWESRRYDRIQQAQAAAKKHAEKHFNKKDVAEGEIDEMAAAGNFGNRIWYHGTSNRAFNKILQSGVVKPFLADAEEPGEAIWLTSDPNEALEYGKIVLAIPNSIVRNFKVERWSGFPHGFIKKYGGKPVNYNMVIKDSVPLKYWKMVDPKTGNLVNIPKVKTKQDVAEGSLSEIGYADKLSNANYSTDHLLKIGKFYDNIEDNIVMTASAGSQKVYFLVIDGQVTAFLGFNNGYLTNIKNFTESPGVVRALIGCLVHKHRQKISISEDEPLTKDGLDWLIRLIQSPGGLSITDQHDNQIDPTVLKQEWVAARKNGEPGSTGIVISENSKFGNKLRENEVLRESKSLLMPYNFYKTEIHKQDVTKDILNELAPTYSGGDGDSFDDNALKRLAAQWWNNDCDPKIESILAAAGWEIGQDEGYTNGGVFVVQSNDEQGDSYISWPAEELENLINENTRNQY